MTQFYFLKNRPLVGGTKRRPLSECLLSNLKWKCNFVCMGGGGNTSQWLANLLLGPAAPGKIPGIPKKLQNILIMLWLIVFAAGSRLVSSGLIPCWSCTGKRQGSIPKWNFTSWTAKVEFYTDLTWFRQWGLNNVLTVDTSENLRPGFICLLAT